MAKQEGEVLYWFSLKGGKRIPVMKGQTKEDAFKRAFGDNKGKSYAPAKTQKEYEPKDTKQQQIAKASENIKKLNAESNYQDELKKGNGVSIKNGKMYFKGKEVDPLDTKDAGEKGHDSLADHLKDGKLSSERQEVHRQIIEEYFKDHQPYAPGEQKVAMYTGGGGASGKGAFSKDIGKFYSQNKNPLVIDPDELKKSLAKADGRVIDDKLTGYYHEESSALAKQIYTTALKNNFPTMYDGTATGGGIYKLVDSAKQYGYKTEMNFIYSDWKTVQLNSLSRYKGSGRLVPLEQLTGAHQKAYGAVTKLQDKFDSFTLWDNAGRNLTKVGTSSLGKQLSISNQGSWDRFSKSASEFTLSTDEIDRYNSAASRVTKYRAYKTAKKAK